jgi:hypothetical protein
MRELRSDGTMGTAGRLSSPLLLLVLLSSTTCAARPRRDVRTGTVPSNTSRGVVPYRSDASRGTAGSFTLVRSFDDARVLREAAAASWFGWAPPAGASQLDAGAPLLA